MTAERMTELTKAADHLRLGQGRDVGEGGLVAAVQERADHHDERRDDQEDGGVAEERQHPQRGRRTADGTSTGRAPLRWLARSGQPMALAQLTLR